MFIEDYGDWIIILNRNKGIHTIVPLVGWLNLITEAVVKDEHMHDIRIVSNGELFLSITKPVDSELWDNPLNVFNFYVRSVWFKGHFRSKDYTVQIDSEPLLKKILLMMRDKEEALFQALVEELSCLGLPEFSNTMTTVGGLSSTVVMSSHDITGEG